MGGNREHESVWETYVRSWKVATGEERRALFESSLSPDFVYEDPLARTEGWDQLITYMREFQARIPGGRFVTQQFMLHRDRSVARWEMQNADGAVLSDGIGYAEYGVDGKLRKLTNFFETPA